MTSHLDSHLKMLWDGSFLSKSLFLTMRKHIDIGGAAHPARWGSCPSYSAARNPPPLSSLRSETGAVPRLGGGCTQAACFFSISSAAGSTSTASCCFPLRVLVGFCKSSALTASRACVCGILQVRSTVNCSRHHHAR